MDVETTRKINFRRRSKKVFDGGLTMSREIIKLQGDIYIDVMHTGYYSMEMWKYENRKNNGKNNK